MKLALSLSGGGARAMCFLGVIRALEDKGIRYDYVYAHSGAALLLCFMAIKKSDDHIIKEYSKFSFLKFFSGNMFKNKGLVNNRRVMSFLKKYTKGKGIEDLPFKTIISISDLTDWNNPKAIYKEKGDLAKYATISATIAPTMPLYEEEGRIYGDGGFMSVYGVKKLKEMGADIVIGMYPDALDYTNYPGIAMNFARVIKSLLSAREKYERKEYPVDLEIRGFECDAGVTDFQKAKEMYDAGYKKAVSMMPQIRKLMT